jgi:hypothetical protein
MTGHQRIKEEELLSKIEREIEEIKKTSLKSNICNGRRSQVRLRNLMKTFRLILARRKSQQIYQSKLLNSSHSLQEEEVAKGSKDQDSTQPRPMSLVKNPSKLAEEEIPEAEVNKELKV